MTEIIIRKRLFWWVAIDPAEPLGRHEACHTAVARAFSRERVIEKARVAISPKPSLWETIDLDSVGRPGTWRDTGKLPGRDALSYLDSPEHDPEPPR